MAMQQCGGVGDVLWAGERATWAARLLETGRISRRDALGGYRLCLGPN